MRRHVLPLCFPFASVAILLLFSSGCSCGDAGYEWCIETTCEEAGKNCGTIDDGCGGTRHCGYCGPGYSCGVHEANVCGYVGGENGGTDDRTDPLDGRCQPGHCLDVGMECGTMSDGCGGERICGFCGGGTSCGGGNEPGVCGRAACTPTTCEAQGADCGQIPDGCGGILDCGFCPDGQSCGGNGAYRCGTGECDPNPDCQGSCGFVLDGCAGVTLCPPCEGHELCSSGSCIPGAASVGDPCAAHQSCESGYCLTESETGWDLGYCTSPCGAHGDCGDGNVCGYMNENGSGVCLIGCSNDVECRDGYVCAVPEGGDQKACIPGGTGNGGVGSSCSTSADCDGHEDGFCLRDEDGFPGGYCTQSCGEGTSCPPGTACAFDHAGRGICVKLCDSSSDCTGDYRCRELGSGITACWPGGRVGDSCNSHNDCATDVCLSEEPHGWTGGYCTELCDSSADCAPGDVCMPYGPDGQGVCTKACDDDSDCRDGYACVTTPEGRSCLPYGSGDGEIGDPCTSTADCAGGEDAICVSTPTGGRCSIRCSTSADCPSGETCVTDGGVVPGFCQVPDLAVDSCSTDEDCGPGRLCVEGPTGRVCGTECDGDGDCPSGTRCTSDPVFGGGGFCQEVTDGGPGNGEAGAPCLRDEDCASGICITEESVGWPGGYCAEPCAVDSDCGDGELCVDGGPGGQRICMSECGTSRECRSGYVCTDTGGGRTVCAPESGSGQNGDECETTSDCSSGLICVQTEGGRICQEGCGGAGECEEGEACRPTGDSLGTGYCAPGEEHGCSSDDDCPPGQTCGVSMADGSFTCMDEDDGGMDWGIPEDFTFGPVKTGDPCTQNDECERMTCFRQVDTGWKDGYCTGSCSSDSDCATGSICGLKRVLEISVTPGGGIDIRDVTDVFGFEPGYGVTVSTSGVAKIIMRIILRLLLGDLFGDFDGRVVMGQCLAPCSTDGECRDGYRCMEVDEGGVKACIAYADGSGSVGEACELINECGGERRGYCMMENAGYPDGYCTINCVGNGACPAGSRCVEIADDTFICMATTPCTNLGASCSWWRCEPNPSCWDWDGYLWWYRPDQCCDTGIYCDPLRPCPINRDLECTAHRVGQQGFCSDCTDHAQCRTDYACYSPDRGPGVCHPSAKGSRSVGDRCSRLRDCAGGVRGHCFKEEQDSHDDPSWPGGYCTRACGSCPSGSTCVELVTGDKFCLRTCHSGSWWRSAKTCRDGYVCHDRGWWRSNVCVADPELVHK